MPHMTPPVDTRHPEYLRCWQSARTSPEGEQFGESEPNQLFYEHFMNWYGTTTVRIDSGSFETSLREVARFAQA